MEVLGTLLLFFLGPEHFLLNSLTISKQLRLQCVTVYDLQLSRRSKIHVQLKQVPLIWLPVVCWCLNQLLNLTCPSTKA
jgi:hypothetical protein